MNDTIELTPLEISPTSIGSHCNEPKTAPGKSERIHVSSANSHKSNMDLSQTSSPVETTFDVNELPKKDTLIRFSKLSLSRAKAKKLQTGTPDVVSKSSFMPVDKENSENFLQGLIMKNHFEIKTAQSLFLTKEMYIWIMDHFYTLF